MKILAILLLTSVSLFAADKPKRAMQIEATFNLVFVTPVTGEWLFIAHTDSTFAPTLPVVTPIDAKDADVKVAIKAAQSVGAYYEWLMKQKPQAFNMPTHPPRVVILMPTHPPYVVFTMPTHPPKCA